MTQFKASQETRNEQGITPANFSAYLSDTQSIARPLNKDVAAFTAAFAQSANVVNPYEDIQGVMQTLEEIGRATINAKANVKDTERLVQQRQNFLNSYLSGEVDVDVAVDGLMTSSRALQTAMDRKPEANSGAVERMFVEEAAKDNFNLDEASKDFMTRQLAISNHLREISQKFSDQSLGDKAVDVIGFMGQSVLPFLQGASASDDIEAIEGSWWLSKNREEQLNYLMTVPADEFPKAFEDWAEATANSSAMFGNNPLVEMVAAESLASGGKTQVIDDVFAVFDAATLGSGAVRAMARAATRASSVRQAEQALGKTSNLTPPDLNNPSEVLPSAAVVNGAESMEDGAAAVDPISVLDEIVRDNEGVAIFRDLPKGETLGSGDLAIAVESASRSLASDLGPIAEVRPRIKNTFISETPGGSKIQNIIVGKPDGTGYKTKAAAVKGGKRLSPDRAFEAELDPITNTWFMKYSKPVREGGFADDIDLNSLRGTVANRWLSSSDVTASPKLQSLYKQALSSGSRMGATFGKKIKDAYKAAKPVRTEVETIIAKLRDDTTRTDWYNRKEFLDEYRKMDAPEKYATKALRAYEVTKEADDLDFFIRNDLEYRKDVNLGYEDVTVPSIIDDGITAREINGTNLDFEKLRAFDVDNGIEITTRTELDALTAKGAKVYRTKEAFGEGSDAVNVIVTSKGVKSPLKYQRVGYRPGGHRIYEGTKFVKQANTFAKNGKTYVKTPLTHTVHITQKQANTWAESMNLITDMGKNFVAKGLARQQADEFIAENSPTSSITSVSDYEKAIADKTILDTPFEVVNDGDSLHRPQPGEVVLFDSDSMDLMSSYITTGGRGLTSKRSKFLLDETDQQAPVLSPIKALEKAYSQILNKGVFSAYQQRAIDSWVNAAKRAEAFTAETAKNYKNADNYTIFKNGELREGNSPLLSQRETINRQLTASDPIGRYFEKQRQAASDFILDSTHPAFGKKMKPLVDGLKDPIGTMKGIAFNAWLGMFNIDQLIVQTQTVFAINSISPGMGVRSSSLTPILLTNFSDDFVRSYAKGVSKWSGLDADEVVKLRNQMRDQGWQNVDSTIAFLDNNQHYALGVGSTIQDISERSRVFFYQAERLNRTHAYPVAWMRFKKRYPDVDPTSEFGKRIILDDADRLTMSMTRASQAAWQQGPASLVTQFQSYAAHLTENILPQMLGGSRNFTGAEKARLAAGQVLFYGTAGLPVVYLAGGFTFDDVASESGSGELAVKLERHKIISQGAFDWLIRNGAGVDSDLSRRVGLGYQLHSLYDDLSEKGLIETLGGPSLSFASNVAQSVNDAITVAAASNGDLEVTSAAVGDIFRNIKSIDNAAKAYLAWNSGTYTTKSGRISENNSKLDLIALQLGLGPSDQRAVSEYIADSRKRKELAKELSRIVTEQNNLMQAAYRERDREAFMSHSRTISTLINSMDPELRDLVRGDTEQWSMATDMIIKDVRRTANDLSNARLNELNEKERAN